MATGNSSTRPGRARVFRIAMVLCVATVLAGRGGEEPATPDPARFSRRAELAYKQAKERFEAASNDVAIAWQFGRAAFAWADFATNNRDRDVLASQGAAACRLALKIDSNSAPAHFYLAVNLGQLARARKLEALLIVRDMERQLKAARANDEKFHYAGPDRCLGLLYLDAPGWPASIGSRRKAREHLERTVTLCPEFPENRLALMEALLRWKDTKQLLLQAAAYEKGLDLARKSLAGELWEFDWLDWDQRWKLLQSHLPPKP